VMFKRSEDLKFYLYTSKTRMLFEQLSATTSRKRSFEWNFKLPSVSVKRSTTTDENMDRDDMVKRVVEELESCDQLGTLTEPKSFIRYVFPIRWVCMTTQFAP
jgi:hypothetical protein